jgi:hypothetical protein
MVVVVPIVPACVLVVMTFLEACAAVVASATQVAAPFLTFIF